MQWFILACAIIANACANICIKAGMIRVEEQESGGILAKALSQPYLWLGAFCFGLALLAYAYSLAKMELSVAYPIMTSLGLIVVAVASLLLFQEQFSALKILGTILIMVGVVLVAR